MPEKTAATELKTEVQKFWNAEPCGPRYLGTHEDFEAHARTRSELEARRQRFCWHQRCKTNSDQGRDHEVWRVKKRFQTSVMADGLRQGECTLSCCSACSISGRSSPRIQRSNGNANPRLGRCTISRGRSTPRLVSKSAFGESPRNFSFPGMRKQALTSA